MKRLILAVCMVVLMAVPAMAFNVALDGQIKAGLKTNFEANETDGGSLYLSQEFEPDWIYGGEVGITLDKILRVYHGEQGIQNVVKSQWTGASINILGLITKESPVSLEVFYDHGSVTHRLGKDVETPYDMVGFSTRWYVDFDL